MEIYEAGSNVAMARAFNPRLKILATSFEGGPAGLWRIWRSLLGGGAGLVIWDDAVDLVAADGTPSPRAQEMAPVLREIGAGLGAQLVAGRISHDRVAVLYSGASQRVRWLLDRRAGGPAWSARGSEAECVEDDASRRSLRPVMASLSHLGVQPRFMSSEQLEAGALRSAGADARPLLLVLPHAIALSDREAAEIATFANAGGTVLADGEPGRYDDHGRRRDAAKPGLTFTPMPPDLDAMAAALARAGAAPRLRLLGADGVPVRDVQAHLFRDGGVTLVGLQRDPAGTTRRLVVELPASAWLHDLRSGAVREASTRHEISLSAEAPAVFALAAARLPQPTLSGPRELRAGGTAVWRLALNAATPAAAHVLHVELTGPDGIIAPLYSGNLVLRGGAGIWTVPFAVDDAAGTWQIRVTDRLGGGVATGQVVLKAP